MLDFVFYKYVGMQYTNFNISIWAAKGVAWYTGDVYTKFIKARKVNLNEYKRIKSRRHLYEFGVYGYIKINQ